MNTEYASKQDGRDMASQIEIGHKLCADTFLEIYSTLPSKTIRMIVFLSNQC